ncbi:hypothetical protein H0H93_000210 [Arthromyces matolae]|nr:hypothetical protein H0H93_000210 [Arthromyces matolae]
MPQFAQTSSAEIDAPYFSSLTDLDVWATGPNNRKLDGILPYVAREHNELPTQKGKLLKVVKGDLSCPRANFSLSFSHHRVTVPPPGWITAAHRHGAKILGTLIFEGDAEEDCLRLLVGHLPKSIHGPAKSSSGSNTLPLSPHYARRLAELAAQRGFDGYLLNFECPLRGGPEQARTLAAWITVLQAEILAKVGSHGETHWYDSVIFTGRLAWQDRLNSLNLPFFLSSTTIFTNYTWPPSYPNTTAQYFLSLDPTLTGNAEDSQPGTAKKALNDIYMGVDVWGRGSHGGGGFGSYKAITHIAPDTLGLSVALFGQGWTWETEQDKPGFTWESWWEYDRKLWVGPISGEVKVPDTPRRQGEPECPHGPYKPIASFFPHNPPPDPLDLPFHTTFSPGVGRAWFVNGINVFPSPNGWTDIDKQCSIGDLLWPVPAVKWDDGDRVCPLPQVVPAIAFEDAWNGGSSLSLDIVCPGSEEEDAMFRSIWIPIQTLSVTASKTYEAVLYYKVDHPGQAELDVGLSVNALAPDAIPFEIEPATVTDLSNGWSRLVIHFVAPSPQEPASKPQGAIGLVLSIITEDASQNMDVKIRLGQLNVYPITPTTAAVYDPMVLWADFARPKANDTQGTLSWEVGASFPPLAAITVKDADDPISAWTIQPSNSWFPQFMYFNIYGLPFSGDGWVGQPEQAVWIGTTGLVGQSQNFKVDLAKLPFSSDTKVRFYVQGVTDRGVVLDWTKCVFVDV